MSKMFAREMRRSLMVGSHAGLNSRKLPAILFAVLVVACAAVAAWGTEKAYAANEDEYFAIQYADGELVVQKGDVPEAGRELYPYGDPIFQITGDKKIKARLGSSPAYSNSNPTKSVRFKDKFRLLNESGEEQNNFFAYLGNCEKIDLTNLDTSGMTDMTGMFLSCYNLRTIVGALDTSSAKDMDNIFSGCRSLESVDLRLFDTSKVEDFDGMFYECKSLKKLDLSGFDTSKGKNFQQMLAYCESLEELDLSSLDMRHIGPYMMNGLAMREGSANEFLINALSLKKVKLSANCDLGRYLNQVQPYTPSSASRLAKWKAAQSRVWYNSEGKAFAAASVPAYTAGIYTTEKPTAAAPVPSAQALAVAGLERSYASSKVKAGKLKKAQSFRLAVSGNATPVAFSKASGSKYLSVSASGKVTVRKGAPVGVHRAKVKVSAPAAAASGKSWAAASKTVTVKVTVGAQKVSLAKKSVAVKHAKAKRAKQTLTVAVRTSSGKVKCVRNASDDKAAKKFKVTKSGKRAKVTVPKGTKKGTYSLKLKVTAAKQAKRYAETTKVLTLKVKVR